MHVTRPFKLTRRGVLAALGSIAVAAGTIMATPAAAQASPACPYPYVCISKLGASTNVRTYKDVTTGWQYTGLTGGGGLYGYWEVVNTRHDDVVYLLFPDGRTSCLQPNTNFDTYPRIVAVRISWSATC